MQNSTLFLEQLDRIGIQLHIKRIPRRQVLIDLAILRDRTVILALVLPFPMQQLLRASLILGGIIRPFNVHELYM